MQPRRIIFTFIRGGLKSFSLKPGQQTSISSSAETRHSVFPLRVLTFIVCWPAVSHQRVNKPPDSPSSPTRTRSTVCCAQSRCLMPAGSRTETNGLACAQHHKAEQSSPATGCQVSPSLNPQYTRVTFTFKASNTFSKHLPARREKDAGTLSTHVAQEIILQAE